MLAQPDLVRALKRIKARAAHGFFSRFVEFRHLTTTAVRPIRKPSPLWGLGSRLYGGRFTPKGTFETVYLAVDPVTAMAEVSGVFYSPQIQCRGPQPPWVLITVAGILVRVRDLTVAEVQLALGTNPQKLTGAWRHIQALEGEAPTQRLGRLSYKSGRFDAIRYPSSKNTAGVCLAVFTDRLRAPAMIKVLDPHRRLAQQLP